MAEEDETDGQTKGLKHQIKGRKDGQRQPYNPPPSAGDQKGVYISMLLMQCPMPFELS